MSPATFRLVLLVSCAHALVHVFELSLPSVEQLIGEEFRVGREYTGALGSAWRLPFGLGALLAGWLADRYGSKPMLLVYLWGCAAMALVSWWAPSLPIVFAAMFSMGCFASIYHPAGLALISRETSPATRGAALGWHGIIGSVGIAGAPFIAGLAFSLEEMNWRSYYVLLTLPAAALALWMQWALQESRSDAEGGREGPNDAGPSAVVGEPSEDEAHWSGFFLLVFIGALMGFVYAGFTHFLPRYLDSTGLKPAAATPESFRNLLAAVVLGCGVAGQAIAGRLSRPGRLELLLVGIMLINAPLLLWMGLAVGPQRLWATCVLSVALFMSQPVYNSLIAQFVPRSRRSLGYGFSNMLTFGVGALGPWFAGVFQRELHIYGGLAVVAVLSAVLGLRLRALSARRIRHA